MSRHSFTDMQISKLGHFQLDGENRAPVAVWIPRVLEDGETSAVPYFRVFKRFLETLRSARESPSAKRLNSTQHLRSMI